MLEKNRSRGLESVSERGTAVRNLCNAVVKPAMAIASCLAIVLPLAAASPKNVPPLMTTFDGAPVPTSEEWENIRRPELIECFTTNAFGVRPPSVADGRDVSYTVVSDTEILDGKARKKIVEAVYNGPNGEYSWRFAAVFPKNARKMPTLFYFDVRGTADGDLTETEIYTDERWPAKKIVERGFATVYIYKSALAPDEDDGFAGGIFPSAENLAGRDKWSWATISAWAWGNSRVFDWLSRQPEVDSSRIAIVGHSRGGKTALWTGATDTRFALVHSIQSGTGGAKLNHIDLPNSSSIKQMLDLNPYWFCGKYAEYIGKDKSMPFDQHMLAALIAPRPLVISSASSDGWAGPEGEWWTASLASPAWELYGKTGLAASSFPSPESPQMNGTVAYFLRTGAHSVTEYEWDRLMEFAQKQGWQDRYWVARNGTGEWTDEANWSDAQGGEGGATVPTANDRVRFSLVSNVVDLAGGVRSASTILFDGVSEENRKSLLVTNGTLMISGDSWPTSGQHEFFNGGTVVFAQDAKLVNNCAAPRMKIEQGVKIVFKDNAEYSQGKSNNSAIKNLVGGTGTYSNELVIADSAKVCWTNGNDSIIGSSDSSGGNPEGVVRVSGADALFKANRLFIGTFWDGSGTANGKGVLIIDSGTVDVTALYTTSDAKAANSTAEIHLNGGKLSCGDFALRKNGTRLLYADSGTIEAKASFNIRYNTTKPQVAEILSGGLAIDTQNYSVGLTMPFTGDGAIAKKGGGTLTVMEPVFNAGGVDVVEGTVVLAANVASAAVRSGAVLGVATNQTFTSLVLEGGATVSNVVSSSTPTCITTGTLSIEGPVTIAVSGVLPSYGPVLTVTEGTISPEDFAKITFVGPDGRAALTLSADGKSAIYWSGDYVWTGAGDGMSMSDAANWLGGRDIAMATSADKMILGKDAAGTIVLDTDLNIGSISFASGTASITVAGGGTIFVASQIDASAAATDQIFRCKVVFQDRINVLKSARYSNSNIAKGVGCVTGANVHFAGGVEGNSVVAQSSANIYAGNYNLVSGTSFTATSGSGNNERIVIYTNSTLRVKNSSATTEILLLENARFTAGNATLPGGTRLSIGICGEYVVTSNLTLSGSGDRTSIYGTYGNTKPGVFKFEKATMSMSQNWFYFGGEKITTNEFYIGSGGLTFSSSTAKGSYCLGKKGTASANDVQILRPWHSDFKVATRGNGEKDFVCRGIAVLCTDDENGTARTITFDGRIIYAQCSMLMISGSGTVLIKSSPATTESGPATVAAGATLAFGSDGAALPGGSLTVESGATLAVTNSVTTGEIGGEGTVTLAADSILAFHFSSTSVSPKLAVSPDATVSLPADGAVKVRVTADEGLNFDFGQAYTLTSNGKFTQSDIDSGKVVLSGDSAGWARLAVVDGNLQLSVSRYFYLRIVNRRLRALRSRRLRVSTASVRRQAPAANLCEL